MDEGNKCTDELQSSTATWQDIKLFWIADDGSLHHLCCHYRKSCLHIEHSRAVLPSQQRIFMINPIWTMQHWFCMHLCWVEFFFYFFILINVLCNPTAELFCDLHWQTLFLNTGAWNHAWLLLLILISLAVDSHDHFLTSTILGLLHGAVQDCGPGVPISKPLWQSCYRCPATHTNPTKHHQGWDRPVCCSKA